MSKVSTGVKGLDLTLNGGLLSQRTYLVHGGPGTGKTTLGLHFLNAGILIGEQVLFISLQESEQALKDNNEGRGFDLEKIHFLDISPTSDFFVKSQTYDIFSPADVEREPLTEKIVSVVRQIKPKRVFIDPITQFRYFSSDIFQFRKQVLSFLKYLVENGITVMFTSEFSEANPDEDLQFMADGIITIKDSVSGFQISVEKARGMDFRFGPNYMKIKKEGIVVYPRVVPENELKNIDFECISTGIEKLDQMLHGGIERGTITIFTGPSGVGKTTCGMQTMKTAASRGEKCLVYSFEEEVEMIVSRCESIGIKARSLINDGLLVMKKIEPLQYSSDEFAYLVDTDVHELNARIVMIDSISGYKLSLRGDDLQSKIHALCKHLQSQGVAILIINEVEFITGDFRITDDHFSHLADNVVFLRYIEINSELRKTIGVLKKRLSGFQRSIREISITSQGIEIGPELKEYRGILKGVPVSVDGE
ncbi:MAG: AAA family ATPase [Bacilli bacterium]|nr:AAA family ATPase [Bacilli bacterium]